MFAAIIAVLAVAGAAAQVNLSSDMMTLTKMRSGVKSHRISSYDRSGNNRDHLKISSRARRLCLPTSKVREL